MGAGGEIGSVTVSPGTVMVVGGLEEVEKGEELEAISAFREGAVG